MRRWILFVGVLIGCLGLLSPQISFASDLSEVLFTKGLMYYDLGRYDLAAENLREAAREDPANLEIRKYLSQAEAKLAGKPSPVAAYEEAVRKDPSSTRGRLNLAVALTLEGQLDAAMAAIEEANRLSPGNGEVLFFRGLILYKKGALKEAISDFQQARSREPRLAQGAMFYEAASLSRLNDRSAAQGLYRRVMLADPTTDYAAEAAQQTQGMTAGRFSAKLTTGVEYDTNAILVGKDNTFGVAFDADDRYQFRFPVSALLDYRFLDVGEWSFGARYGLYASVHDESSDMNVISNLGELYGVWRTPNWFIRPFYYYQSVFLGGDQYSDSHSIGGNFMYFAPFNLAPELFLRFQHREYNFATLTESDPDGWSGRGELNQYYLLQGGRGHIRAGLGLEGFNAQGRNMDYTALLLLAGAQYILPWDLRFNFDFEYQSRSYGHVHSIFDTQREDLQYSFAWQLSKPLGRGFEVTGRIAHIRNDSNIGDFDYNRQIYSLLFSWNY